MDMQNFQSLGCKAYIHVKKKIRRKYHKGCAELKLFWF